MRDKLNDADDSLTTAIGCAGCLAAIAFCLFVDAIAIYGVVRLVGWLGDVFGW